MKQIEKKYIEQIKIPGIENGLTMKNLPFFDFPDSQYQLIPKKAYVILCVDLALLIFWFAVKEKIEETFVSWILLILIFAVALWYQHEIRYMEAYKNARKSVKPKTISYCMRKLQKIVESEYVYTENMPLAYTVLKTKQLLEHDVVEIAESMIESAIEEHQYIYTLWYIAGLCAYAYEDKEETIMRLNHVIEDEAADDEIKKYSKELLASIS